MGIDHQLVLSFEDADIAEANRFASELAERLRDAMTRSMYGKRVMTPAHRILELPSLCCSARQRLLPWQKASLRGSL